MSMLPVATVLARKYRPRRFAEVVGQDPVVQALQHGIRTGRLHHAYLLTGSRGVGKTTLARILAKALNCEQREDAEPCNACSSCQSIDRGRHVDVLELDAASHRGVGDIQEVLEQTRFAPTNGRYKVLVIDEVHMLSGHAFNAMLKTLEEPPPRVMFVLATTDPQKIPVTILSRCLQFSLRNLPIDRLQAHLASVLGQEGILAEPSALLALARAGRGSVRDALSLTDQAIAVGAGAIQEAHVAAMLGLVSQEQTQLLADALLGFDVASALESMDRLLESGAAPESILEALAAEFHDRLLAAALAPGGLATVPDLAEGLQLAYQIAVAGRRDLGLAPDEVLGLRMTLLRVLAFRPTASPLSQASSIAPASSPAPGRLAPARHVAPPSAGSNSAPAPSARPLRAASPPSATEVIPPQASPAGSTPGHPDAPWPRLDPDAWTLLMEGLPVQGMVKQLALHSALAAWPDRPGQPARLVVTRASLIQKESLDRLALKVGEALGVEIRLEATAVAAGAAGASRSADSSGPRASADWPGAAGSPGPSGLSGPRASADWPGAEGAAGSPGPSGPSGPRASADWPGAEGAAGSSRSAGASGPRASADWPAGALPTAAAKAATAAQERQEAAEQAVERSEVVQVLRQQFDGRVVPGSISPCSGDPPWAT